MYTLDTSNLPILSTFRGWKHGFESPFKAEVYFVNTRRFTDQKWGTKNPIMLRDPEFGPTRLRAFGTYAFFVSDAGVFLEKMVGTSGHLDTSETTDQIRNLVVARFTDVLASSGLAALDLAANLDELGGFVSEKMAADLEEYGLTVVNLLVENVSLPPEGREDARPADEHGRDRRPRRVHRSSPPPRRWARPPRIPEAEPPPAWAWAWAFAMANQMGQAMAGGQGQAQTPAAAPSSTPPPPPPAAQYHVAVDGQTTGPFSLDDLRAKAQSGELTGDTHVWNEGMSGWQRAGDVDAFKSVFGAVPPPPPPAG